MVSYICACVSAQVRYVLNNKRYTMRIYLEKIKDTTLKGDFKIEKANFK